MSFGSLLAHRVKVHRRGAVPDRFGQPTGNFDVVGDYQCRATMASGGESFEERSREVYKVTHKVYVENWVDVREDDRVEVYDPTNGNTLFADGNVALIKHPYGMQNQHHKELRVELTRGPSA